MIFVDTGAWFAAFVPNDPDHSAANEWLAALVTMKLTSDRDIDRVHVGDLLSVGLIDRRIRDELPPPLLARLEQIELRLEE